MLVSHQHKFIYLKTKKTAGTSVEIYFENFCIDPALGIGEMHKRETLVSEWGIVGRRGVVDPKVEAWYNHMPASLIRKRIGDDIWNRYFKFCVIRNPFDKTVSQYWHGLSNEERDHLRSCEFGEVQRHFRRWVLETPKWPSDRDKFMIGPNIVVDDVIRYERLSDDLARICQLIGVPWEPHRLGRYKGELRVRPEPFELYFDGPSKDRVREVFALDLKLFQYDI